MAVEAIQGEFLQIYRAFKTLGKDGTIALLKGIKVNHQSLDALKGRMFANDFANFQKQIHKVEAKQRRDRP